MQNIHWRIGGIESRLTHGLFRGLALALVLASSTVVAAAQDIVAYVSNFDANTVSVLDTTTNRLLATISGLNGPLGLATTPDGKKLYVANGADNTVSVIATATNKVTSTIPGFDGPEGLAVTADGSQVLAANAVANTVSVIATTRRYHHCHGHHGKCAGICSGPDNLQILDIPGTVRAVTSTRLSRQQGNICLSEDLSRAFMTPVADRPAMLLSTLRR